MFHSAQEVLMCIKKALVTKQALSLVRLGNGEALTLAHQILVPMQQIEPWLEYAGVKLPNEQIRQDLLAAIKAADILGLTTDRPHWDCAPLLNQVLAHFKFKPRYVTDASINWQLHRQPLFYSSLANRPLILVGRLAAMAAPVLSKKGLQIVATYALESSTDLPTVERMIQAGPLFQVALVAAGIPASILCPRLAKTYRCVALDYGHVINDLLQPGFNNEHLPAATRDWIKSRTPQS